MERDEDISAPDRWALVRSGFGRMVRNDRALFEQGVGPHPARRRRDAGRAIEAAHRAFSNPDWAELTGTARGALLRRLADLIEGNVDQIGAVEQRDNGKPMAEVSGQVRNVAHGFTITPGLPTRLKDRSCRSTARRLQLCEVRAAGRRRRDHTVELAAGAHHMENGARAGGGQHPRHRAERIHVRFVAGTRSAGAGGGFPGRRG